ncbi:3332_t:CDS:2, partial [Acaulospora colombiana]
RERYILRPVFVTRVPTESLEAHKASPRRLYLRDTTPRSYQNTVNIQVSTYAAPVSMGVAVSVGGANYKTPLRRIHRQMCRDNKFLGRFGPRAYCPTQTPGIIIDECLGTKARFEVVRV